MASRKILPNKRNIGPTTADYVVEAASRLDRVANSLPLSKRELATSLVSSLEALLPKVEEVDRCITGETGPEIRARTRTRKTIAREN